jgi:hypothetical protein
MSEHVPSSTVNVSGTVKMSYGFITGVVLGVLTGGAAVLVAWWMSKRGLGAPAFQGPPMLLAPGLRPIIDIDEDTSAPALGEAIVKDAKIVPPSVLRATPNTPPNTPPREYARPIGQSFLLPGPGQDAIRVASTTDIPYMVQVRPVDPPGAFAILSFSPTELNIRGPGTAVPIGDTIVIPVGQWQNIPMGPNMALYARGNQGGANRITLSVSGSPVGG